MKFYVLLTVATVVIIGSYFFMKNQAAQVAEQKQIAAGEAAKASAAPISDQARDQARMEQAARLAEQEDAALAANGANDIAGINGVDQLGARMKLNGPKRVKVVFGGNGPSKLGVKKTYDHMDDSYIAGSEDETEFKYSSAKYSHPTERKERASRGSEMSDDLLIVESRLEDRVERARQ